MKRTWLLLFSVLTLAPLYSIGADTTPVATSSASRFDLPATDEGLPGAGPIRRYDWFTKLWTERRTGWAKRVQQDQNALIFLGDSITQGWGDVGSGLPG